MVQGLRALVALLGDLGAIHSTNMAAPNSSAPAPWPQVPSFGLFKYCIELVHMYMQAELPYTYNKTIVLFPCCCCYLVF